MIQVQTLKMKTGGTSLTFNGIMAMQSNMGVSLPPLDERLVLPNLIVPIF